MASKYVTVEEKIEATPINPGFTPSLVGTKSGLDVQPRCLVIETSQYERMKSLVYVTNTSDARQYIKFTSSNSSSFIMNYMDQLEAGETMVAEIKVLNVDFQLTNVEVAIYVYYSRVRHPNLRIKNDGRSKIVVRLAGEIVVKKKAPEPIKAVSKMVAPTKVSTIKGQKVVERQDEAGKNVVEFKATKKAGDPRTKDEEIKEL
ncbi:hypothetical protein M3Y94_00724300 [Aphelenchoides besseyi]|nr:hypothetical protein M3Y94_00724300 [Aphelenchoides besseyi]KAI6231825.1 hypothetical protein M3Y95_00422100 [Aphelenchoides besseyi]